MRVENSFLPVDGVGERRERSLWESGITHWREFEAGTIGPKTDERVLSFIETARERLAAGDAGFFDRALPSGARWRLYENFRPSACFLDIETTGLDAGYANTTTVSLHDSSGTKTLVRGDDLGSERLARELTTPDLLVTFNGARFDIPFLETEFDLAIETPHLDLLYPCRRLDLTGGLKAIETDLGIDRESDGVTGRDAIRLWRAYRSGDEAALDRLVRYNRDDTENLRLLADLVADRLHGETLGNVELPDERE